MLGGDKTDLILSATNLLWEIESFSVSDWAQPGDDYKDWLAIGSTYKHAVAVYCIMSLQSLGLLPDTPEMSSQLQKHGDLLGTHLRTTLATSRIRRFANWPLVVAGVEAGYRSEARRRWFEECCVDLARSLGNNSPLNMKTVMRKNWDSGVTGWEESFVKPHAFMF